MQLFVQVVSSRPIFKNNTSVFAAAETTLTIRGSLTDSHKFRRRKSRELCHLVHCDFPDIITFNLNISGEHQSHRMYAFSGMIDDLTFP